MKENEFEEGYWNEETYLYPKYSLEAHLIIFILGMVNGKSFRVALKLWKCSEPRYAIAVRCCIALLHLVVKHADFDSLRLEKDKDVNIPRLRVGFEFNCTLIMSPQF